MDFEVPVNIALMNNSNEVVGFRFFKVNMTQELKPGEFVKISTTNSDELAYYMDLNDSKIGLIVDGEIDITSIEVTTPPTKTTYFEGDVFDSTGMVIESTDEYGEKKVITNYTISPVGELNLNDTEITISYLGVTTTQAITVNAVVLESIEVTTPPTKVSYVVDETFDPTGMVVTGHYNNGTNEVVEPTSYNPSLETPLTIDDTSIEISYNGLTTTQTIEVTTEPQL